MGFNSTLPEGLLPIGDVDGMRRFLSMLITPPEPRSMYVQIYVAIGIVFGFVVLAFGIVTRRLMTGSGWLVMIHHTTRGSFIMPNAVLSLAVFFAIYDIVCNCLGFVIVRFYRDGYQANYQLFRALFAFPAFLAALSSCAGTLGLFPGALRFHRQEHNKLRFMLLHPTTFHAVLFGAPVLCLASVLTPALIGNRIFNRVPAMHSLWLQHASEPSANIAELAAEAKRIWLEVTHAYYYESVTFGIWVGWVFILTLLMFSVALHVLLSVRAQVKIAERKKDALARTQPTFYFFSSRPNYHNIDKKALPRTAEHTINSDLSSPIPSGDETYGSLVKYNGPGQTLTAVGDTLRTSIAPPSLPASASRPEKLTRVQAAFRRSTALKLVYRNLMFQYAAILLGAVAHGSNALLVALTSYRTSREVTTMSIYHQAEILMVTYVNILCIGCVIIMILWRSLDPAFTLGADSELEEMELPITRSDALSEPDSQPPLQSPQPPLSKLSGNGGAIARGSTVDLSIDTPALPSVG